MDLTRSKASTTVSSGPRRRPDPPVIAVAGDWHGNIAFAVATIRKIARHARGGVIVHAGDFGVWPGLEGARYLDAVNAALLLHGMRLWFVDGNHEDYDQLAAFEVLASPPPYYLRPRIAWLPRGYRWTWHDRVWVAAGGAVSVDKAARTEGEDWWPGEAVTAAEAARIAADGHADVMVTHDCPAGVTHSMPALPSWIDLADVARAERHAGQLQTVVDAVQPRWLFHGHLHLPYQRTCDFGWGPVEVTGLDRDTKSRNWVIIGPVSMGIWWPPIPAGAGIRS